MPKKKVKVPRVQSAFVDVCRTKLAFYWHPLPYDKKHRQIPTSVDCLFNQEYYEKEEAKAMLEAL